MRKIILFLYPLYVTCVSAAYIVMEDDRVVSVKNPDVETIYKEILCKFDTPVLSWYFDELTPAQKDRYPVYHDSVAFRYSCSAQKQPMQQFMAQEQIQPYVQQQSGDFPIAQILNEKIKLFFPNKKYTVKYIPNTLFELAVLLGCSKAVLLNNTQFLDEVLEIPDPYQVSKRIKAAIEETQKERKKDDCKHRIFFRDMIHKINTEFFPAYCYAVETITELNFFLRPFDENGYVKLYSTIAGALESMQNKPQPIVFNREISHIFPKFSFSQLHRILTLEEKAEQSGEYFLYRGNAHAFPFLDSAQYQFDSQGKQDPNSSKAFSIAFNKTLLSGNLGISYEYMNGNSWDAFNRDVNYQVLYAVVRNPKTVYSLVFQSDNSDDIFFDPPYSVTFCPFFVGEWHPRNKLYVPFNKYVPADLKGFTLHPHQEIVPKSLFSINSNKVKPLNYFSQVDSVIQDQSVALLVEASAPVSEKSLFIFEDFFKIVDTHTGAPRKKQVFPEDLSLCKQTIAIGLPEEVKNLKKFNERIESLFKEIQKQNKQRRK